MSSSNPKVLGRSPLLRTVEGEQLLNLAAGTEVNEVLSYEYVKATINVDLQTGSGRQLWRKVQATLAAEQSMQFACIPKVGYKRLDDDSKVDKSGRYIGQAVKRVRAASRVHATTDRAKLSASKALAYDVQVTVASVLQTAAKPAIVATRSNAPSQGEIDQLLAGVKALK